MKTTTMRISHAFRISIIISSALFLPPASPAVSTDEQIAQINDAHGGVGLTAWSVDDMGNLCSLGCAGERLKDSGEPFITTGDSRHHIGSVTKGMTASLLAILIEDGSIPGGWDTTLKNLMPIAIGTSFEDVPLRDVVSHHAGIVDAATDEVWARLPDDYDPNNIRDVRRAIAEMVLLSPPAHIPGTAFLYTNWGFVVAGHIVEETMDQIWEYALSKRLFVPLGIDLGDDATEFFGAPNNNVDPVGHLGDEQTPCFPSSETTCDLPQWFFPAGSFSGPVSSMARYLSWHIQCHNGNIPENDPSYSLLSKDSCRGMHQPADPNISEYGYGWWWLDQEWAGGRVGIHHGFNRLNYYYHILAIGMNRAFVAYTNSDRPESKDGIMLEDALAVAINATLDGEEECDAPIPSSYYIDMETSDPPSVSPTNPAEPTEPPSDGALSVMKLCFDRLLLTGLAFAASSL